MEKNQKKILFVIPYLADGGAERALSNITTHWDDDWEIDILVNSSLVMDYAYRGNIISLNIDKEKKVDSVWFQLKVLLKRIRKLRLLKKQNGYEACISFIDSANIANILSGNKKCKTIISIRASLNTSGRKKFQYRYFINPLARCLYNYSDKVVSVSSELKKELVEYFKLRESKIVVIQNGYDTKLIKKDAEKNVDRVNFYCSDNITTFISAGRITSQKYQWHLIRAFAAVTRKISNVLLVIAGDGVLKEYLEKLVQKEGVSEKVLFTGQVDNLYSYYYKSDICVLPSGWEGFPNALAEAMCVGLPCIATDFHTGAREILAPELLNDDKPVEDIVKATYGILTPLCSGTKYEGNEPLEPAEEKLAEAMIEMLENDELREHYKKQSIVRSESYSIDDAVKKWINLITE